MTLNIPPTDDNHPESGFVISVCVLASGSKGNAIFVSDGSTSILIDAGLSGIEITNYFKPIRANSL